MVCCFSDDFREDELEPIFKSETIYKQLYQINANRLGVTVERYMELKKMVNNNIHLLFEMYDEGYSMYDSDLERKIRMYKLRKFC